MINCNNLFTITCFGNYNFNYNWNFNFATEEALDALMGLKFEMADLPEMPEMPEMPLI